MTKKIAVLALVVFAAAGFAHAFDMEIAVEMKTGVFWDDDPTEESLAYARIHNNYDAGIGQGRLRMDWRFWYNNLGAHVRFEQTTLDRALIWWPIAFAYGNFVDDQLRVSVGRLGPSPWEWGGPLPYTVRSGNIRGTSPSVPIEVPSRTWLGEHRGQLDDQIGIRVELMPAAVPGLNVGFVLNEWDGPWRHNSDIATLRALLMESVLGVAYTNDHFHGRLGLRLDSETDGEVTVIDAQRVVLQEGKDLMYMLDARFLGNIVPWLSTWATGWWSGLGANDDQLHLRNWLYVEYAPVNFIAELRLGVHFTGLDSHVFTVRPSFYYNILPFFRAGMAVHYELNFGASAVIGEPFQFLAVEPQVKFYFGKAYLALVYGFENRHDAAGDLRQRHWINLRTTISF